MMCGRTAWKSCWDYRWRSVFGTKRGKNGTCPGPPVHDDLVKRDFSADDINELRLTDITEHGPTRASSTCALSRTCSPARSSATRSATE